MLRLGPWFLLCWTLSIKIKWRIKSVAIKDLLDPSKSGFCFVLFFKYDQVPWKQQQEDTVVTYNSSLGDHFRLADLTVVIEPSELVAFRHCDLSATFQGVGTPGV